MLVEVALDGILVGVGVVFWFRNTEREVDCCVLFFHSVQKYGIASPLASTD